jgi:hypothetical protein
MEWVPVALGTSLALAFQGFESFIGQDPKKVYHSVY